MKLKNKINVAYIIDSMARGGTESQLKLLIEGLDTSKYEIFLFLLRRGDESFVPDAKGLNIYNLNISSISNLDGIKKIIYFAELLKKKKINIIQTFMQDATIVGVIASKIAGVRRIIVSIEDMQFWANSLTLAVHRFFTFFSTSIRVNSFAIKKNIEKKYRFKDIHVIHNGVLIDKCIGKNVTHKRRLEKQLSLDKDVPVITIVSNCNRIVKRVDIFIEAAFEVLKKSNAYFLIVGDGHLRKGLEERSRSLGISQNVKFLGRCANVPDIYAGSDIAVNTSDSEGLSNSVLEGMGAGLPVAASAIPGNKEVVIPDKTGLLFKPGDYKSLSEIIIEMLNDNKKMVEMGSKARNMIFREFSVKDMVKNHEKYYNELYCK